MKLSKAQFDAISNDLNKGVYKRAAIALRNNVSENTVQRVKQAGTWQRWPYVVARNEYGYMTPEYKTYLKRRGLPIVPPALDKVKGRKKPIVTKSTGLFGWIKVTFWGKG